MKNRTLMSFLFIIIILFFLGVSSAAELNYNSTITSSTPFKMENSLDNEDTNIETSNTIAVDSTNFDEYVTDGKFNDKVNEGDIVDITGKLDGSRFALEVDKPVNIISSNGEGYIDFKTMSTTTDGGYTGGIFQISKGGSGSNVTGITFHNTHLRIENTSNIHIDNINSINIGQAIGKGVGAVSIREGSENISITNSYFRTENNGGHSNVVFAAAYNCLFENNTIEGVKGNNAYELIGNLLYLTTYNVRYAQPISNINITIRNNKLLTKGIPAGEATCYGLVLEGKGHIIENNYIDTNYPVMAQYADIDYDFETNIDGIIFNNNTIARNTPQLVFPGIVSNNTFYGGALLKQVYAYNNNFNTVTIQNNVKFENNAAKQVTITGNNNILENNEIFSDEDYVVIITDENNTLENNKLASYLGEGENAISNSTEIISINNSNDFQRIFNITNNNFEKYFEYNARSNIYTSNYTFKNNDIIYVDVSPNLYDSILFMTPSKTESITVIVKGPVVQSVAKLTVINSTILTNLTSTSKNRLSSGGRIINLINSIVPGTNIQPTTLSNSIILGTNYQSLPETTYILWEPIFKTSRSLQSSGYLLDQIINDSTLLIGGTPTDYMDEIYIDRKINITGLPTAGFLNNNILFIESSKQTTVTGITFNGKVTINDENIMFTNCTFNGDVEVNNEYISFEDSVFNGNLTLNQANFVTLRNNNITLESPINITSTRFMGIENNIITTTSDSTILFDDESSRNTVKNNILTANTLLGDDSVVGGDNIVEDNGATYNTSIEIIADETLIKNDVSNVTVTVYNLLNNTPVDRGYVEVYLDGIVQGIKPLVNGQITLEVNTDKSSFGSVPLKVWYYDGIRYANNVSSISVNVVKSNVSISLDEFTAKLNEKATVTATFLNQNNNSVMDTNVTFTVGRSTYTTETDNGVATINELVTTEWLDAGKLIVSFPNTDAYNSNSTTITLNTSKADIHITPSVTVEGSTANINLALTDELNSNVTDGKVTITTLNGSTQLASGRVSNGVYTATVTIPDDYASEYLVANFTGSYYYNDLEYDVKLTAMLNSTITVVTNSPLYGEELIITGKLVDSNGDIIADSNITLNVNTNRVTVSTDAGGEYNYTFTPGLGVTNITATYAGSSDVYGSSASTSVTIRDTDREMNEVLDRLDELQKENEKLHEQLEQLQEQNNKTSEQLDNITQANNDLKEQLENITQANEDLAKQLEDITNNLTDQNKDLQDQNNVTQEQLDALKEQNKELNDMLNRLLEMIDSLNKPVDSVISLDEVSGVKVGDVASITGTLVDAGGNGIAGTVKLTINGGRATVTSDASGTFAYDYVVTHVGDNEVVATYAGTDKYNPSNTSMTFSVGQQDTVIVFDEIADIISGQKASITGQLVDAHGNGIYGTVKLTVNNGRATVKTDKDGYFSYNATLSKVGVNNITGSYLESAKYLASNATTIVNVNAIETSIIVDEILPVKSGDKVTITGKLVDANANPVVGTIKLLINNGRATVKTDTNGVFSYEYTLTKVGTNNITLSYLGANRYTPSNTVTTVVVSALNTMLTIDPVTAKKGETITLSGKLVDEKDNPVVGTVKLLINGGRATVKTDSEGVFTYDWTVSKVGINNITATYLGANRYTQTTISSTIEVVKAATTITLNPINTVTQKTSVDITGQLNDEFGNGIYGTVKLLINGGRATVKTDKAGAFTYSYNATRAGENTITANYLESNNYEATESTTTFTVVKVLIPQA